MEEVSNRRIMYCMVLTVLYRCSTFIRLYLVFQYYIYKLYYTTVNTFILYRYGNSIIGEL